MQRQVTINGTCAPCSACGRNPYAYVDHRRLYFLECAPCGRRSCVADTAEAAASLWDSNHLIFIPRAA